MDNAPYQVDCCVASVMYLTAGAELSGADVARLWADCAVFGKEKVRGQFWYDVTTLKPRKARSVVVGSPGILPDLEEVGSRPLHGAFSGGKGGGQFDLDFFFAHDGCSRSFGYESSPALMLNLSRQWIERIGVAAYLRLLRTRLEIVDLYRPRYGLVDVTTPQDCCSGFVFMSAWTVNAPLHRYAEEIRWQRNCAAGRDRVRGYYWGNYFGAGILARLGGRDRFVSRFNELIRVRFDGELTGLLWEFSEGVFVGLSPNPLDCTPGSHTNGSAAHNLHWLLAEFAECGVDPESEDGDSPRTRAEPEGAAVSMARGSMKSR